MAARDARRGEKLDRFAETFDAQPLRSRARPQELQDAHTASVPAHQPTSPPLMIRRHVAGRELAMPDVHSLALAGATGSVIEALDQGTPLTIVKGTGLYSGWTLLHCAASKGHLELVQVLLARGASTSVMNAQGKTPAQLAADKGHQAIAIGLQQHHQQHAHTAPAAHQPYAPPQALAPRAQPSRTVSADGFVITDEAGSGCATSMEATPTPAAPHQPAPHQPAPPFATQHLSPPTPVFAAPPAVQQISPAVQPPAVHPPAAQRHISPGVSHVSPPAAVQQISPHFAPGARAQPTAQTAQPTPTPAAPAPLRFSPAAAPSAPPSTAGGAAGGRNPPPAERLLERHVGEVRDGLCAVVVPTPDVATVIGDNGGRMQAQCPRACPPPFLQMAPARALMRARLPHSAGGMRRAGCRRSD